MTKKKILSSILAVLLLTGALLAGCGNNNSGDAAQANAAAGDSVNDSGKESGNTDDSQDVDKKEVAGETIYFGLASGSIRTALVILADKLGYYEEEGVNVEFIEVQDATAALTSISMNKEVDVWGTGIVPGLNFIANGSDLVIFEGTAAEGGAIIALPENVEKYKDLDNYVDLKAACIRADTGYVITRSLLKEKGIDVDNEIKLMELDSQMNVIEAVLKGEAEVGFLPAEYAYLNAELGIEVVYEVGELSPLYVCCRQVTSRQTLENKHDEFVRFTAANLRAYKFYLENPEEVVKILAEFSDQTEEYVNQYIYENKTPLTLDPNQNGIITFYNALKDAGYFETDIDIEDHIDTAIYKEALDLIIEEYPEETIYQDLIQTFESNNL